MPTYDYRCEACGHELEIFHSISEPARRKCPRCGKRKLERRIGTGAGIIFKGSGFYQTDYRSESYQQGAKADTAGDATSKTGDEAAKSGDSTSKTGDSTSKSGDGPSKAGDETSKTGEASSKAGDGSPTTRGASSKDGSPSKDRSDDGGTSPAKTEHARKSKGGRKQSEG